jgi:hypothetical protein
MEERGSMDLPFSEFWSCGDIFDSKSKLDNKNFERFCLTGILDFSAYKIAIASRHSNLSLILSTCFSGISPLSTRQTGVAKNGTVVYNDISLCDEQTIYIYLKRYCSGH